MMTFPLHGGEGKGEKMDGQMKLDICKAQVVRVKCSPEEWQRRVDESADRQREWYADKIIELWHRHEREALKRATECEGQMEVWL